MKTLNFNIPLQNVNGTTSENQTLASTLSELIGTESEGKTLKLYGWHKSLQVGDELILDDSDIMDLKKLIEENKRLYVFVKGQLLDIINKAE